MKAIIEETIKNITPEALTIFAEILNSITSSRNEAELRRNMENVKRRLYQFDDLFVYGFGSSHMWVCEQGRKNRLIFVEF